LASDKSVIAVSFDAACMAQRHD